MFAKIKAQLIIGVIMLALFVSLGMVAKHYYDENLLNKKKVDDLILANKDLNNQITLFQKSKDITDSILAEQRATIASLNSLDAAHKAQVTADVKKILDKFKGLPPTPDTEGKIAFEVSTVRVIGLWKTYCVSHPEYAICAELRKEK